MRHSQPPMKNWKQTMVKSSRWFVLGVQLDINNLVKEVNNHKQKRRKNHLPNKRKGLQIRLEIAVQRKRSKVQAARRKIIFRSL